MTVAMARQHSKAILYLICMMNVDLRATVLARVLVTVCANVSVCGSCDGSCECCYESGVLKKRMLSHSARSLKARLLYIRDAI